MSQKMKKSHIIILILSIVIVIGFTWSQDIPLALQVPLRQQPYFFTNLQFNLLYVFTFLPICFSDIPVGILLDKLPIYVTIIYIAMISLISEISALLIFNFRFQNYKVFLYIVRGVFGITGQASFTILTLLISRYGGVYYDSLMGFGLCMPYVFDSLSNVFTPLVYDSTNSMNLVWGIGCLVCLISLIAALTISFLVKKDLGNQKKQINNILISEKYSENQTSNSKSNKDQKSQQNLENKQQQKNKQSQLNFEGLKTLPKSFWIIVGAVFSVQYNLAAYYDNLNDTIVKRFQIPYLNAGYLMFIPYGLSVIFSFIIGKILQKRPKFRRPSILWSSLVFSTGLFILYMLPNIRSDEQPNIIYYILISLQFLSISYGMAIFYTCLSPSIKYVVNENNLGMAWGVVGAAIGLSSALGPFVIAFILQTGNNLAEGYENLTLSIFLTNFISIGFQLWILFGDFQLIDVNSTKKINIFQIENLSNQDLNQSLIQDSKYVDLEK